MPDHSALRGRSCRGCRFRRRRCSLPRAIELEINQRRTGGNGIAGLAVQRDDHAGLRRRHSRPLPGGFQCDHRLVDCYAVAHGDMPAHDFRFLQSFAQVRQIETSHDGQP